MVYYLRLRDLVKELRTVTVAEATRFSRFGGPAGGAAEDCVDLDRPDRELSPGFSRVLLIRRENHRREPVSRLVGLLQGLVERRYDLDGGDWTEGLLVHHGHPRSDARKDGRRVEEAGPFGYLPATQELAPASTASLTWR